MFERLSGDGGPHLLRASEGLEGLGVRGRTLLGPGERRRRVVLSLEGSAAGAFESAAAAAPGAGIDASQVLSVAVAYAQVKGSWEEVAGGREWEVERARNRGNRVGDKLVPGAQFWTIWMCLIAVLCSALTVM